MAQYADPRFPRPEDFDWESPIEEGVRPLDPWEFIDDPAEDRAVLQEAIAQLEQSGQLALEDVTNPVVEVLFFEAQKAFYSEPQVSPEIILKAVRDSMESHQKSSPGGEVKEKTIAWAVFGLPDGDDPNFGWASDYLRGLSLLGYLEAVGKDRYRLAPEEPATPAET